MLTFILGECALELVPEALVGAPSVKKRARNRRREPNLVLLDQAVDHEAMEALPDHKRRGRPDIVHLLTLLVQDSPLTAAGKTRLLWHTQQGGLVRVRPDLRPPRAQATFYKLCEDLLRQGAVPMHRPLLQMERGRTLASVIEAEAHGPVVLLAQEGTPARSAEFGRLAKENADLTIVIGGFPHGDFLARPKADHVLRVASTPLTAASALIPVLAGMEDTLLPLS